jgi:hypothetical protein
MLGPKRWAQYKLPMDHALIDLGVFLAGAAGGAALSYLKDRRLLHLYGDLVRQGLSP